MRVQLETQNVTIPQHARGNLSTRVERAMSHMRQKIVSLHLSLRDVNGAKGGRDKQCTVRAQLVDGGEIVVVSRDHGVRKGMFTALRKCKKLVGSELKKRRQQSRRRTAMTARPIEPDPA